jgi:hypothetical protein
MFPEGDFISQISLAEEEMLHTYYYSIQSDAGTTTDKLTTKHLPFRWKQRCIGD